MGAFFGFIHIRTDIHNNSDAPLSVQLQVGQVPWEPRKKNHCLCLDRIKEGFYEEVAW